jgi:hypothetical protein
MMRQNRRPRRRSVFFMTGSVKEHFSCQAFEPVVFSPQPGPGERGTGPVPEDFLKKGMDSRVVITPRPGMRSSPWESKVLCESVERQPDVLYLKRTCHLCTCSFVLFRISVVTISLLWT